MSDLSNIFSAVGTPLVGLIALKLGHIWGRNKTEAEVESTRLENLQKVVNFYKDSFDRLETELKRVTDKCVELATEIQILQKENVTLKQKIDELKKELKKHIL